MRIAKVKHKTDEMDRSAIHFQDLYSSKNSQPQPTRTLSRILPNIRQSRNSLPYTR